MAITGNPTDWTKKTQAELYAAYDAINDLRDLFLVNNLIYKEWDQTNIILDQIKSALDNLRKK